MPVIQNVIRGGQLFLHGLRMFGEILRILIIWFCISSVIIFGLKIYFSIDERQWKISMDYCLAFILEGINLGHNDIKTSYLGISIPAERIITLQVYKTAILELKDDLKDAISFSWVVSLGVSILAVTCFVRNGINKIEDKHKRGASTRDVSNVSWSIRNYNRKRKYYGYSIAGVPYPEKAEMQHSLVIGTTGTGKTVLISDIVEQIRARGDRAIIFDTKGCYVEWFYNDRKDHILNPFDKRSEKWNLLKEVRNTGHIKSIAQSFIPEGKGNSGIWNESGRIVFTAFIEKLMTMDEDITNKGIADLIMKQGSKEVIKFLKGTYAQSIIDTKAPETTGGVMFTLSAYLNSLRLMDDRREESFSIKEWCSDASDSFLFITSSKESSAELLPLQTAWWEIVFNGLMSNMRNSGRKTWIILDEVGSLQQIPSLQETMSKTREYDCCFVLGMQDIGQLEEVYGQRHSRTISTLCNTRCIFRTPDPYTSSWLSKNIGDQELEQVKEGLSYGAHQIRDGVSVNRQNVIRPLVMASEIQNLKDLELYLQLPNYPFVKTKLEWKKREIKTEGFIENNTLLKEKDAEKEVSKDIETDNKKEIPENSGTTDLSKEEDQYSF